MWRTDVCSHRCVSLPKTKHWTLVDPNKYMLNVLEDTCHEADSQCMFSKYIYTIHGQISTFANFLGSFHWIYQVLVKYLSTLRIPHFIKHAKRIEWSRILEMCLWFPTMINVTLTMALHLPETHTQHTLHNVCRGKTKRWSCTGIWHRKENKYVLASCLLISSFKNTETKIPML